MLQLLNLAIVKGRVFGLELAQLGFGGSLDVGNMFAFCFFKSQVWIQQTGHHCDLRSEFGEICSNLMSYRVLVLELLLAERLYHAESYFDHSVFHMRESASQVTQTPLHDAVQKLIFAISHILFNHCSLCIMPKR